MLNIFFAYVDPGIGTLIWQILAATAIGFIFYSKRFFSWIKGLFKKNKKEKDNG